MVTAGDAVSDIPVDSPAYAVAKRRVGNDSDQLIGVYVDGQKAIRIWDCIEGGWSGPFDPQQVYEKYLRKVVFKCSLCNFSSIKEGDVKAHAVQARATAEQHRGVGKVLQSGESSVCPGCGFTFSARKLQLQAHIANSQKNTHQEEVQEQIVRRYSLEEQSEPVMLGVTSVAGPVASQVAWSPAPIPTGGRRRRRRRRARGNRGRKAS